MYFIEGQILIGVKNTLLRGQVSNIKVKLKKLLSFKKSYKKQFLQINCKRKILNVENFACFGSYQNTH
jgi:hypothetical protein